MIGPYVHNIDPVFGKMGGFHLWWYGLGYTLGFLGVFFWLRRNRGRVALGLNEVYELTLLVAGGALVGGRLVEVFFYEWAYYGTHLRHIPAIWLGGMSTHGILLGAILGIVLFCRLRQRSFLEIADLLAIAGAYVMGVGRIGNFIDGQIVGSLTDVWWGVQFPDAEGFRHPVVLYDGIKNLMLIPFLLLIRRTKPPRGAITGHMILWYGFLRIFVDLFREYRTDLLGFPPGQEFNLLMTVAGAGLLFWIHRRERRGKEAGPTPTLAPAPAAGRGLWVKRLSFVVLLLLPTVIPSDWTQDVPERYGKRHPGLRHTTLYPRIAAPPETEGSK